MGQQFIHLHVHTEFSIIDGIVRVKPLVKKVAESGMAAVAITDVSNLFAVVKFYRAAHAAGIKAIIGADIWLENEEDKSHPYSITLLCQNDLGYRNLTKLISKAYLEGQHLGKAIVQRDWLQNFSDGLICLSGAMAGELGHALLKDDNSAKVSLERWSSCFSNRFYIELQRCGYKDEELYIQKACQLAEQYQIPVVATNNVRFLESSDFAAHEARVCIHDGNVLADNKRPKHYTEQQFLRSPQQMVQLFEDIPEALANSVEIAKRCNVYLHLGENYLPNFPIPEGMTTEQFFSQQSKEGLEKRLLQLFDKDSEQFETLRKAYDERLQTELDVINQMGFPGYFLIVADFIRWAKQNQIPVGPGRGSGAGSLVAYALLITDLDPIAYDLLFERFLNPERVSMPDFDIDFCMDGRDRVIDYVAENYGRDAVSQIITFGTMAAKAVVRDVGRVMSHPYGFVDKLAKLIPFEIGMTLNKALEQEEALKERYDNEEEVAELIDLALKLEGVTRNAGKHAGGVVISPTTLTDFSPIYCESDGENLVTQFDKDDVEAVGLVKFDFLGLRTLTIIDWALQAVNASREKQGLPIVDISTIAVNDAKTFELLKDCQTTAIFQLESRGMKDLIKRLQPDCFEDIVALVALFRPGPLQSGMVDDFIDRKHGRAEVAYPHPSLEPVLKPTYGVILYQEQVMQIAQVLAGYSLGGADILRRAMGKKKPEEMAKQRIIFTEGSVKNGVDKKTATYIFDLMEKFAGYGFNKSHSAAYALVSYQTAWLKTHYPAEFMAAALSSDMDNTDKVAVLVDECKAMKLTLVKPDINASQYKFVVNEQGSILYGLGAIKGVGEAAIEDIIANRQQQGHYNNFFEFCQRVNLRRTNKRVLESLIRSGAMDSLGCHRASLLHSIEKAMKSAEQAAKNEAAGQHDLFAIIAEPDEPQQQLVDVPQWREQQRLLGEKETLGLYLSGHPVKQYAAEFKHFVTKQIYQLRPSSDKSTVIAGMVLAVRSLLTKRGNKMAIVTIDDGTGKLDIALFSETYEMYHKLLIKDEILVISGEVSEDDYSGGIRMGCKVVMSLSDARQLYGKGLLLKSTAQWLDADMVSRLATQLDTHDKGNCPVVIQHQSDDIQARLLLHEKWHVAPKDSLINSLKDLLGDECVSMLY